MTDINAINGYTQTSSSSTTQASSQLSADMQLKYQDPLDPMDTADFTNQLVQYSSVEQAIQTNEKLDSLLSLNMSNLGAQAVSYIGKVAQCLGNVMPLENGIAKATYTLDKNVESAVITVKDLEGNIVYSQQGNITAGTHDFEWNGKDLDGNQLEDGAYQIEVTTKVGSGETSATVTTTVFGRVTGVASDSDGVYVGLGDAVTANLSDILTVRNDDYFDKTQTSNGEGSNSSEEGEGESSEEDSSVESIAKVLSNAAGAAASAATFGLL